MIKKIELSRAITALSLAPRPLPVNPKEFAVHR
jgi:hypothetical protein